MNYYILKKAVDNIHKNKNKNEIGYNLSKKYEKYYEETIIGIERNSLTLDFRKGNKNE